jgi:predicted transcriptional regulator
MEPQYVHSYIDFGKGYVCFMKNGGKNDTLFNSLDLNYCNCLLFTRNDINSFSNIFQSIRLCNYTSVKTKKDIVFGLHEFSYEYIIQDFCRNNNKSIVILDRTDYFLEKYSFYFLMNIIYNIHETIIETKSILLVFINDHLLNTTERILLENELHILEIPCILLNKNLFDILEFVLYQNQKNRIIDYKTVIDTFHITYPTLRSRIKKLTGDGLITSEKNGRNKHLYITNKGKKMLKTSQ